MYSGTDFPMMNPGESRPVSFDFTSVLQGGETVVSVEWGIASSGLLDPYAATHLGAGALATPVATNQVSGLMGGAKYVIEASATTSAANIYALYSHIICQIPT